MMEWDAAAYGEWQRRQQISLLVGVVALGLCAIGAFFNLDQFFRSYLVAYLLWLGTALGCLTIAMIQQLTGGTWGVVIRRMLEAGTRTMPLMALLFVPFFWGTRHLYSWMSPDGTLDAPALNHPYLNVPFFFLRATFYFVCWLMLVYLLNKWSGEHDRSGDFHLVRKIRLLSAAGLVLYVITATFAAVDWVMSLEPHWYSTIYGVLFMGGQVLSAFAFVIVMSALLARDKPLADIVRPEHFHDLGNLLLAFVMLWAYFGFSQYLIIWSGNLPAEIPWYVRRLHGGWQWLGIVLIVFHFFVPFLLLLGRTVKRRVSLLATVAGGILFMRWVDLFWFTAPAFHPEGVFIHWMDVMAPVGIGGIWLAVYISQLKGRPLLPIHDPYVLGTLHHGRA